MNFIQVFRLSKKRKADLVYSIKGKSHAAMILPSHEIIRLLAFFAVWSLLSLACIGCKKENNASDLNSWENNKLNSDFKELDKTNDLETKNPSDSNDLSEMKSNETEKKDYIKWVDFSITYEALDKAYEYDIKTYGTEVHLSWIELLAYLGTKYGGDFSKYKEKDMTNLVNQLNSGSSMEELTKDLKFYSYYLEAYGAVLGGFVGEYEVVTIDNTITSNTNTIKYGLKAFSPIAKGFEYRDYDDFGASRSYGYKRIHLGHDMMGQTGTPIICVESGYVEALGWNQYGGWRIGIRSFDGKRYYYYAHLRKDFPYNKSLTEGSVVQAGDVIGYMGHMGYSVKENVNNIETTHLHFGIQLIFDESQKEGNNEIWIDCYQLVRFLYRNRSETVKNQETKEWERTSQIIDPTVLEFKVKMEQQ